MHRTLLLLKWIWRSWPGLITLLLITIHFSLIYYFCFDASATHKNISLISQLVGGILILYSIDSNIGILKEKNLLILFSNYLKDFPFITKSYVINVKPGKFTITPGKAKITVTRNPQNIEEHFTYLQEQINSISTELEQSIEELNEKYTKVSNLVNTQTNENKTLIKKIESQIEDVSIGGLKIQLSGILLVFYGAISGYIA